MNRSEALNNWLGGRPEIIRSVATQYPPWHRYRLKTTGQHVNIESYFEDGTVSVEVNGHDSSALDAVNGLISFGVFGIDPDDLEVIDQPVKE